MSATSGPDIISDGLVFYYDTGNSRDSYLGEPTTNLVGNPTFIGTSGTQTQGVSPAHWVFSGYSGDTGFKFYNSSTSPIPLKFPNEGAVITTGPNNTENRRIYFRRTDLLPNTTYSISCWMYFSRSFSSAWSKFQYDSNNTNVNGGYFDNFSNYASANGYGLDEWFLWQGTLTTESTTSRCYWGPVISKGVDILVGMQRMQVEVKPHITQFTTGTRSSTQGLLDISGQGTSIDLSNVSFDSNAQMTFDGTDDKLHGIQTVHSYLSSSAIEFIVSPETSNKRMMVGGYRHNGGYSWPTIGSVFIDSDNKFKASVITTTEVYRFVGSSTTINANQTYHVIFNKNTSDGTMELYVNGILQSTQTFDSATYAQWASAGNYIGSNNIDLGKSFNTNSGQGWSGDYLEGKIHIFKIHSRILTAAEVKQNYDSVKARFGLT